MADDKRDDKRPADAKRPPDAKPPGAAAAAATGAAAAAATAALGAAAATGAAEETRSPVEPPASKKLFVGVRVSVQTANALASAAETLARRTKDANVDIKWVAPVNYHATLKYLGWTREDAIVSVCDALATALLDVQPLKFRTARLGAFPSLDAASVVWAGVDAGALDALAARVETAMTGIGFAAETRAFHAHVTLGRLRETRPLKDVVLPLSEQMFSDTRIDGVSLFESETKSSGSVYKELHRIGFKVAPPDAKRQTGAVELVDETDDGWPRGHSH